MKKTTILFILLIIGSISLNAQTQTLIYGNLGVENVNISGCLKCMEDMPIVSFMTAAETKA